MTVKEFQKVLYSNWCVCKGMKAQGNIFCFYCYRALLPEKLQNKLRRKVIENRILAYVECKQYLVDNCTHLMKPHSHY